MLYVQLCYMTFEQVASNWSDLFMFLTTFLVIKYLFKITSKDNEITSIDFALVSLPSTVVTQHVVVIIYFLHDHIQSRDIYFFHDGGRYHIETSPLICRANQWTSFYIVTASVMKELNGYYTFHGIFCFLGCDNQCHLCYIPAFRQVLKFFIFIDGS